MGRVWYRLQRWHVSYPSRTARIIFAPSDRSDRFTWQRARAAFRRCCKRYRLTLEARSAAADTAGDTVRRASAFCFDRAAFKSFRMPSILSAAAFRPTSAGSVPAAFARRNASSAIATFARKEERQRSGTLERVPTCMTRARQRFWVTP